METPVAPADRRGLLLFVFRIIGWPLVALGPWIFFFILQHWQWVPEWFSNLVLAGVGLLLVAIVAAVILFASWKLPAGESQAPRIVIIVLVSLNLLFFSLGLLFAGPACGTVENRKVMLIDGKQFTFYTQHYYGGFLTNCYRIWYRNGSDATFSGYSDGHCRCSFAGEPTLTDGKVRFYFHDNHLLGAQHFYMEFHPENRQFYEVPTDSLPGY